MKGVDNLVFEKALKESLKKKMNFLKLVLNESEKFFFFLVLRVKEQVLIEIIVFL